jgi:hypothetical protein
MSPSSVAAACMAAVLLFLSAPSAEAGCVTAYQWYDYNERACKLELTNNCNSDQRCFVKVESYAPNGQLYANTHTLYIRRGNSNWFGSTGTACGGWSFKC